MCDSHIGEDYSRICGLCVNSPQLNMFQKNLKSSPVLQPGGQACLVPEPKQTHKHTTHKHIALETLHEHIRSCSHVGRPSSHSTEACPRRCLIPLRPWSRRVHTPCLRMVHG